MITDKHQLSLAGVRIFEGGNLAVLNSIKFRTVVTLNADLFVEYQEGDDIFKDMVESSCCTIDGQVPRILMWLKQVLLFGRFSAVPKVSGSDLIFDAAKLCGESGETMAIIGGSVEANAAAVRNLSSAFSADVKGLSVDIQDNFDFPEVIRLFLTSVHPQILFVCLGTPKQEKWIYSNREFLQDCGVRVVIGAGGAVDFAAAALPRAPVLLQHLGFEGVYRLLQQPGRRRLLRLLRSFRIFFYITR